MAEKSGHANMKRERTRVIAENDAHYLGISDR